MNSEKMLTIKIDGTPYQVKEGSTVLQAAEELGIHIPHYCYHPALSIAGNCRMCLCKIEGIPKPAITCDTRVAEGMEVHVDHPDSKEYQKQVMEFLLINHPLDCPICDQSGECDLQNNSYSYGNDKGAFREEKVQKTRTSFGQHVLYWGNRCILCTRCVRFTEEITGTGELAVINRGDHSEIACHPDIPLDNPLSMNVIDICPVGALCSKDFLFQVRVWNTKRVRSISPSDSMGCNVYIDTFRNRIKRMVPRINHHANGFFIPDENRLDFEYVYSEKRFGSPEKAGQSIPYHAAISEVANTIKSNASTTAILVSLWQSNEAMLLARQLMTVGLKSDQVYVYGQPKRFDQIFPKFVISGDRNPNRRGAAIILQRTEEDHGILALKKAIESNKIQHLIVLASTPHFEGDTEMLAWKKRLKSLVVVDFYKNQLTEQATLLIPSLTVFEQNGSFINHNSLVQAFVSAHQQLTAGAAEAEILWDIWNELEKQDGTFHPAKVFNRLVKDVVAMQSLQFEMLGDQGYLIHP